MASVEIPEGLEELFQQTWFDHVLHYGLLVGAVFQLICIAAIVLIPPSPEEEAEQDGSSSDPGLLKSEGAGEPAKSGVGAATVAGGVSKKTKKGTRKRK